jgi:uracil-DNA glycosylase family 4
MGMKKSEIYDLLILAEDYLLDGFRHDHPPLGSSSEAAAGSAVRAGPGSPAEADPGSASGSPAGAAAESTPGAAAEPPPGSSRQQNLEDIAREVAACTACALHRERRNTVAGEGVIDALVMVIGEGPGAEEDRIGRPFVGRAGNYLDRWLAAIDLDRRSNCFIGNIVKCRPPGNRDPLPEESAACLPFLKRQIRILEPKTILTLGRIATQILCGRSEGIGKLRGQELDYLGIPVVATYHPSAVLRNTDLRAAVWEDLKRLRGLLDLKP